MKVQSEFPQEAAREAIEQDLEERIEEHQRAIAAIRVGQITANRLNVAPVKASNVFLALGDSWFNYPLNGNSVSLHDTGIIAQLSTLGHSPPHILNIAHYGDAATVEMSLPKQERLIKVLANPANWLNGKPDAILVSAGGNDVAGDQFCIFVDFNDGKAAGLNQSRFAGALDMVKACYEALFALRDRIVPGVPIFGHCYDLPVPNGIHPRCAGPWLKPSLDFCNWSLAQGQGIVHDALVAFRDMLKGLEKDPKNLFHVVETQGTLTAADWANELHPFPPGFVRLARKFAGDLGL